jgi:hypothetical protein
MEGDLLMSAKERRRPATADLRNVEFEGIVEVRMTIREVHRSWGCRIVSRAAAISGFVRRETPVLYTAAVAGGPIAPSRRRFAKRLPQAIRIKVNKTVTAF